MCLEMSIFVYRNQCKDNRYGSLYRHLHLRGPGHSNQVCQPYQGSIEVPVARDGIPLLAAGVPDLGTQAGMESNGLDGNNALERTQMGGPQSGRPLHGTRKHGHDPAESLLREAPCPLRYKRTVGGGKYIPLCYLKKYSLFSIKALFELRNPETLYIFVLFNYQSLCLTT